MRFFTEVRENIACFGRLITSISPMMRGFTPMSEQREGIHKCRERKRGRGEKQISPRYTNLPESAHVAFDVSRNSQILSREPVRPMKPKEGKLFGRIEFVIAQQRLLEHLVQMVVFQWIRGLSSATKPNFRIFIKAQFSSLIF